MSSNKTQQELDRLQALDAALNEDPINADIDRVLNSKQNSFSFKSMAHGPTPQKADVEVPTIEKYYDKSEGNTTHIGVGKHEEQRSTPNPMISMPDPERAPESADRYSKAKLLMMTKQLSDAADLRQKMEDHIKDLQQQLKNSRDENGILKKRIQQLELEVRKATNTKKVGGGGSGAGAAGGEGGAGGEASEALNQEVKALKKDIATFERMAKQSEETSKNKDAQLKRAADTIARLKIQLQEAQNQVQNGVAGDHNRAEQLEQRVKQLEKQRAELIDGFKKQMKLIDVLKRQKIHLEAARLLAFTEEEFLKTLEWKA